MARYDIRDTWILSIMDPEQALEHFKTFGYVVVPIFTEDEVKQLRQQFHQELLSLDIDHDAILSGLQPPPLEVKNKSRVSEIRNSQWKVDAQMDPRITSIYRFILDGTFMTGSVPGYEHPLGVHNAMEPFIDRMCYRLPDKIRAEGGLAMHMDRNPGSPYTGKMYRPIQSFIALTDHYTSNDGGLQLVTKFHKEYDHYFRNYTGEKVEGVEGDFFRMHGKSYDSLRRRLETICVPAGSIVLWDNRIPHATCDQLLNNDTREVIYFSFLPAKK